jgi:hypothetical protein
MGGGCCWVWGEGSRLAGRINGPISRPERAKHAMKPSSATSVGFLKISSRVFLLLSSLLLCSDDRPWSPHLVGQFLSQLVLVQFAPHATSRGAEQGWQRLALFVPKAPQTVKLGRNVDTLSSECGMAVRRRPTEWHRGGPRAWSRDLVACL